MADKIGPEKDGGKVEEVFILDESDGTALPEGGASSGGFLCCSSSSSSSCCSAS